MYYSEVFVGGCFHHHGKDWGMNLREASNAEEAIY
jgi:hypothetical protein